MTMNDHLTTETVARGGVRTRRTAAGRSVTGALLFAALITWLGISSLSPASSAAFSITSFGGSATDAFGTRAAQAGGHPDLTTLIRFSTKNNGTELDGQIRDATVELPPGLIGNPEALTKCPFSQVASANDSRCVPEAQVGIVTLYLTKTDNGVERQARVPLYNIVPPPGKPARFTFNYGGVAVSIDPQLRTGGDYGIDAVIKDSSQSLTFAAARVTLWGVPADPAHDAERYAMTGFGGSPPSPSAAARIPFVSAPTSCSGEALAVGAIARSWEDPTFVSASFDRDFDGFPLINEGCGDLRFDPSVSIAPSTLQPDAPTGLDVNIDSPQNLDAPDGLVTAHLRDVKVTLPDGITVNPGSADGLQACADEQFGLSAAAAVSCPDESRIGTVTATSPLVGEPLAGGVYIRSQASSDPESGEMFRLGLVLENKQRGLLVKLAGAIRVNRETGQITTEFANNPQLPVEHISLRLKTGPRAPLATPPTCGDKAVDMRLTSWAGHEVSRQSSFKVPCTAGLGGFAPSMSAGTVTPVAGVFSPFALAISKPDGNTPLTGLSMVLPTGLLAQLKGNQGTQVGTVKAFAGPGSNPFMLPGQVYLEGAYGDAPFSLRVVVPAKAGPFDLGEVVVRQKIYVDPIDAHVTVVSDPLPTIVKGVPVRLQRVEVNVDKAGFIINPTSCDPTEIKATLSSATGQSVPITNRFQVGDCASLALKPSLALALSGKGQTTDGKHPAISATLTQPFGGQANLKKVRVALPLSLALDPDNANGLCEFVDGSKATPTCPASSIVGSVTATTPILDEPLSGPVYFVKNIRKDPKSGREIRTLPKLVIPMVGQNGVKLTLTGTSAVEDDQLVTTFDNIPDAPVSSFRLNVNGGKGGILVVSDADICKSTQIADQQVDGQNNKSADADVFIQTPSCALKVVSKKVGKSSVAVKVSGLGAGKVTLSGKGIKKTTKTITKSTVATITAKRTKGKPKQIKVSFLAKGAKKAKTVRT
jgi:hypothetical protein